MSLQYVVGYQQKLQNFLSVMNPNIDWSKTLNEIITYPIEKLLNKIRSYLWMDKDIDSNNEDEVSENTFIYYQRLLYMLNKELDGKKLYIIGEPKDENDKLIDNDVINNKVLIKLCVLKNLLTFKRIKFEVINECKNIDEGIVFPVCSVMWKTPDKLMECFSNCKIVDDGYYNLYNDEKELEFDILRLMLVELFNNPSYDVTELMKVKYGLMKVDKDRRLSFQSF